MKSQVRIGCSSAFWGDSVSAAHQLVKHGNIDYLVADYLAEVTMGILAKRRKVTDKRKLGGAGAGGYVAEFVNFVWKPLMNDIMQKKIRVVTNAGGMDPVALKVAIENVCKEAGVEPPIIAAVYGDDLLPHLDALTQRNAIKPFSHITDGKSVETLPEGKTIESLNAYLGALPIKDALDKGAQVVVTGRVVDSAIVLGPLMHEFNWKSTDYDLLAAGSLAGHIIECGCQATGGNFTDWKLSAFSENGGWSNMGYPVVECYEDGSFVVTKPDKTGGIVTIASVGEQMVYEIGDPSFYILPDVIVDLRRVKLKQLEKNRVHVSGAKGLPPTPFLKISGIYTDGYKVTGELLIGGIDARKKAIAVGEAILARVSKILTKFGLGDLRGTNIEVLGSEFTYGPNSKALDSREVVLRLSAHHDNLKALQLFLMEIAPSATCMAPGIIGVTSGRPRPNGNMVHFASLVEKKQVVPRITIGPNNENIKYSFDVPSSSPRAAPLSIPKDFCKTVKRLQGGKKKIVRLVEVCIARSGDKGDSANIGVICRKPEYYPWILNELTEEKVFNWMKHLATEKSQVQRYLLPGCYGLNFLLTSCLGGGGLSSLQVDRQGKTYAQMLLSMPIEFPESLLRPKSNL